MDKNRYYTSSEGIAELCEVHAMRAKYVTPGNKMYPHGIMTYKFNSEGGLLMMLREIGDYWTLNHPDVAYMPLAR